MKSGEGTDSRVGRWVRGTCAVDGEGQVLLYETDEETGLVCATHYRSWSVANPVKQACDNCGSTGNVWRDPVHRRNEYLCINCHDPDTLFQNRWANKVRESKPLGIHAKAECAVGSGITECKGEIKWRSAYNMLLCNRHAGKTGVGPNG
jgi:hypothetical protein